ncbi:electron transfer flavoprotein alpha subunit apoprotein [Alteromonadaceae bacterium Bs31]|nr:electron transfer flavoprotein alpha subunit apoprotein [Alteromonadaceae bacterium Bs31]
MSVLVIAEHDNAQLKAVTLNACAAAKAINDDVHLLVIGTNCGPVVEAASKIAGIQKVLLAEASYYEHQLAEELAPLIASLADQYTHVLAAATSNGKNVLPRAAALHDCQLISEIIKIVDEQTFCRPIYAGNVIATVKSLDSVKFLSIRPTAFDALAADGGSAVVESIGALDALSLSVFDSQTLAKSDRPDLSAADIVVSGGRGLQSSENFELLYTLADKLQAAVGASRAAVDAGFVANDLQVGQTGKVVAPELYIAIGISGAIQHLAGMKESKVIVAINKDEDAPIFQVSDYGLVADLFDVLPELSEKLS